MYAETISSSFEKSLMGINLFAMWCRFGIYSHEINNKWRGFYITLRESKKALCIQQGLYKLIFIGNEINLF